MKPQSPNKNNDNSMRLARFMSLAGVASRRNCEELIVAGHVTVNGQPVTTPAFKVSETDTVMYNGRRLRLEGKVYIMLNKPPGYMCSYDDPHAEKTVYDLIKIQGKRIFSAGRLDMNSEGLLILTNDGDYAEKLTHPRFGTLKKYRVRTSYDISSENLEKIRKGIRDEGEFLKPKSVKKIKTSEYLFIMAEGKKREIRRLVAATGVKVTQLRRIAVGELVLGNLPKGKWRYMNEDDIKKSLASSRKGKKGAPNAPAAQSTDLLDQ